MSLALPAVAPAAKPVAFRRAWLAALAYVAALAALCAIAFWLVAGLLDQSRQVDQAEAALAQLNGRVPHAAGAEGADAQPTQSPFIEGQTITVAGAALQRRIEAAATQAGGVLVSSQVELDGPQAKDGFITVSSSLELAQDRSNHSSMTSKRACRFCSSTPLASRRRRRREKPTKRACA